MPRLLIALLLLGGCASTQLWMPAGASRTLVQYVDGVEVRVAQYPKPDGSATYVADCRGPRETDNIRVCDRIRDALARSGPGMGL
jgi:hypothetical protein